jgi:pimeloyl-ACP methyl ester carboxylesterase
VTPIVLVHGGAFAASCWDLLLPHLDGPVLAVDLPGRGAHPADLSEVTLAGAAESVVADVDAAGFDEVVLVGHSLAGSTLPGVIGRLGDRVRHAVFVACTVPEDGRSSFDTLDADTQTGDVDFRHAFGNDLDDDQWAWCESRMVPEAMGLVIEPVYLRSLHASHAGFTWIRTLQDAIVDPDEQLRFAHNVPGCQVVDLDAGHMCMISQPAALAEALRAATRAA